MAHGGDVTDEQRLELSQCLQELSKHENQAIKLITSGDATLGSLTKADEQDLLQMNLNKLKSVAHDGEEVTSNYKKNTHTHTLCQTLGGVFLTCSKLVFL